MAVNKLYLMAGGGTGGHVIPALAVAGELRKHGHEAIFVGTKRGVESRLVPPAGFQIEFIEVGGIKNLGFLRKVTSFLQLLFSTARQWTRLASRRPTAVFSMGGFVAGPPVLAAILRRIPVVVMEPNAAPGLTNRWIARYVHSALLSFPETAKFFPAVRTEVTGLPVREEFFRVPKKPTAKPFTVLITGGSQGSRTLNNAARDSWPLFAESRLPVRFIHQTGIPTFEQMQSEFAATALDGEVSAFIQDMPAAFAKADLIVCRSGAGTLSEVAAAGKPAILIPFPFAADDHQLRNAQAFQRAGAARLFLDREWTGREFFDAVRAFVEDPSELAPMGERARSFAHPGAALRAAQILEEIN
jgi:UDP-N-acetylglucosamine--N-acetylmuramyl-(pentapeptide) pyrophosphoryl-undecaprenol N-acetylglucosamine transferase